MSEVESVVTQQGTAVEASVTEQKKRLDELDKCVKTITKTYEITTLNVLNTKFYKTNYNLYRDIVAGYKQQNQAMKTSNETGQEGLKDSDVNNTETGKK